MKAGEPRLVLRGWAAVDAVNNLHVDSGCALRQKFALDSCLLLLSLGAALS